MASRSWRTCVGVAPGFRDRQHVKHCETLHLLRVIERKAVGTRPPRSCPTRSNLESQAYPSRRQAHSPSPALYRDSDPPRAGTPLRPYPRRSTQTDRAITGEMRRDMTPHQAGSRKSMDHEQWGSPPVAPDENGVVVGLDLLGLEEIGKRSRWSCLGIGRPRVAVEAPVRSGARCSGHHLDEGAALDLCLFCRP